MTANSFQNTYADKAASSLENARAYLYDAIERLDECETMMRTDGDWGAIAELADLAFTNGKAAIMPLGSVSTYALKRASFR